MRRNKPFPLDGGRVGMGVFAEGGDRTHVWLGADSGLAANFAASPPPCPPPSRGRVK